MRDGHDGLAKGIPQITQTPERWPSVVQMIQRAIEQARKQAAKPTKPLEEDFETIEEFLEAEDKYIENLIDWKIEQHLSAPRSSATLMQRLNEALSKALPSQDPENWRGLRQILGEWLAVGVSPVASSIIELDGSTRAWLFDQVGDAVVGHREDGTLSFFWSSKSGILLWGEESLPAVI